MPDVGWLATCGLLTGPRSASEASCSQARDSSPQGSLAVMADQGSLLRVPAAPASAVARTNYAAPPDDAYNYLMRPARAARFRHVISACDRSYRVHARRCGAVRPAGTPFPLVNSTGSNMHGGSPHALEIISFCPV